jgi:hypothetical protein
VTWPKPEPGLVIRYAYLWHREHVEGREEGSKDRPCAIIVALADDDGGARVTVLPITHAPPADPATAIALPDETKKRLGLDSERAWILLSEGNEFLWPGPDLRPVPGSNPPAIAYGFLPPRLFNVVRTRFVALARERRSRRVPRTE